MGRGIEPQYASIGLDGLLVHTRQPWSRPPVCRGAGWYSRHVSSSICDGLLSGTNRFLSQAPELGAEPGLLPVINQSLPVSETEGETVPLTTGSFVASAVDNRPQMFYLKR